jgi:hypothetical protein
VRKDGSGDYTSIQSAVNAAGPGDIVEIGPGTYYEEVETVRSGTSAERIVIRAQSTSNRPILRGQGINRGDTYLLFDIKHNYVTVSGLELTNAWRGARIDGGDYSTYMNLYIHHIGRTGIEVQHHAIGATLKANRIHDTGMANEGNAEAIYIGTARSATSYSSPDLTRNGLVEGNVLGPRVAEGIDFKDDAYGFRFIANEVYGAVETASGAINLRGHTSVLSGNYVHDNLGAGIRIGGTPVGAAIHHQFRDNRSTNNAGYGYKCIDGPQDVWSNNSGSGNSKLTTGTCGP